MDAKFSGKDTETLRSLAHTVAEIASRPEQEEKADLWKSHNMLNGKRPMFFISPEGAWKEILLAEKILCENELARIWETTLRREIYRFEHFHDDKVIDNILHIPHIVSDFGCGIEFKEHIQHGVNASGNAGSYNWDAPIKTEADLKKLKITEPVYFKKETEARYETAKNIFNGILEVRLAGSLKWSFGLTQELILLRGLGQSMLDMVDNPQIIHEIMRVLKGNALMRIKFFEDNNLLTPQNGNLYCGSGGFCFSDELPGYGEKEKFTRKDIWGFAESQELVGVSPEMFEEFAFKYQKEIIKDFGLAAYGCCEPLDKKYHIIKKELPNLRRVSVSPWSNLETARHELGKRYIISCKPNPAVLAAEKINESQIRTSIREILEKTIGGNVEIIMKDTHTVRNEPERFDLWAKIAREEIGKFHM